ncbi:MAG: hypothetical protein RLZZ69_1856, partial [Cyanobacteriota bacterium]
MIFQLVASNVTIYQTAQNDNLKDILSVDRFGRYLQWSGQDELRAYELYALNTQLSESLYTPLQMLEIALRNSIHRVLTASYSEYWFDNSQVISNSRQQADIQNVKQDSCQSLDKISQFSETDLFPRTGTFSTI